MAHLFDNVLASYVATLDRSRASESLLISFPSMNAPSCDSKWGEAARRASFARALTTEPPLRLDRAASHALTFRLSRECNTDEDAYLNHESTSLAFVDEPPPTAEHSTLLYPRADAVMRILTFRRVIVHIFMFCISIFIHPVVIQAPRVL